MQSLHELQRKFSIGLFEQDANQISNEIISKKLDKDQAFQIYINNFNLTLCDFLNKHYPVIWRLLGKACAMGIALRYIREQPQEIRNFETWPSHFPVFLANQNELKTLPYLKDVARLEWVKYEALIAKNVKQFTPEEISSFCMQHDETKTFIRFDPGLRLIVLEYPAKAIINTALDDDSEDLNISPGQYHYMIYRKDNKIYVELLQKPIFNFLTKLKHHSLSEAAELSQITEKDQYNVFTKLIQSKQISQLVEKKHEIIHL